MEKKQPDDKKIRKALCLTPENIETLDELRNMLGKGSHSEVVRALIEETEKKIQKAKRTGKKLIL